MKTFKIIASSILILLLGALVYFEARPFFTPTDDSPLIDSTAICSPASQLAEPITFSDFHQASEYQTATIERFVEDSVFRCMDIMTVQDIAYMLIRDGGFTSVRDIVHEYLEHQNIYDSRTYRANADNTKQLPDTIPRAPIENKDSSSTTSKAPKS